MNDLAIRAVGLGKRYRIGAQVSYKAMRDTIMEAVKAPLRATAGWMRGHKSTKPAVEASQLWALRDVAFEIKQGQAVGIIGRNGSGKSTLLKVLAQVTEPTEGYAEIRAGLEACWKWVLAFIPS
jgi:lipopolysaccharide transport system ATP-binding protein